MPLCTWRNEPPLLPDHSPDICEILPDLRKATNEQWYVEEYISHYESKGWLWWKTLTPIYVYALMLLVHKAGEYQVINGVTTEREVLAYAYGAIGTKLNRGKDT